MNDHEMIVLLTALVSALGLKEVWAIIKQKMDINAKKEEREDEISLQIMRECKEKIEELEKKIDELIKENIELREKLARMEERLMQRATKSSRKPRAKSKSNGTN